MKQKGFTLIEILIAMFIASIVAVMAVNTLGFSLRARTIQNDKAQRLSELQLAYVILQNDIEQAVNRPIHNKNDELEPGFKGGIPKTAIQFTHGGMLNPLWKETQSALQRVNYELNNDHLVRVSWQALDQGSKSKSATRILLTGVSNLTWEFINPEGIVFKEWQTPISFEEGNTSEETIMENVPNGVRLKFEYQDIGSIEWLFILVGAQNAAP